LRSDFPWDYICGMVLKTGSCAAESYEPRQVRKEAAVSSKLWVPQGCLARAISQGQAKGQEREWVHDPLNPLSALFPIPVEVSGCGP